MDTVAAHEIELWIDNDRDLERHKIAVLKNLYRKHKAGRLDKALAPKLLLYLVEAGMKSYGKQFGMKWNEILNVADRKALAASMAAQYVREVESGEAAREYPEIASKQGMGDAKEDASIVLPKTVKKQHHTYVLRHLTNFKRNIANGATITVFRAGVREYYIFETYPFSIHGMSKHVFGIENVTEVFSYLLGERQWKSGALHYRGMDSLEHVIQKELMQLLGVFVIVREIR